MIFCLQIHPGDAEDALTLAKLLKETSDPCPDVTFMVAARRDTDRNYPRRILDELGFIANTIEPFYGESTAIGYPTGCNQLWREVMMRALILNEPGDGILTFEPDCIPCRMDWMQEIVKEWAITRSEGKKVMGHRCKGGTHINGNLVAHRKLLKDHPHMKRVPRVQAWDVAHGRFLVMIGRDTPAIYQRGRILSGFSIDDFHEVSKHGQRPALWHGIKDPNRFAVLADYAIDPPQHEGKL